MSRLFAYSERFRFLRTMAFWKKTEFCDHICGTMKDVFDRGGFNATLPSIVGGDCTEQHPAFPKNVPIQEQTQIKGGICAWGKKSSNLEQVQPLPAPPGFKTPMFAQRVLVQTREQHLGATDEVQFVYVHCEPMCREHCHQIPAGSILSLEQNARAQNTSPPGRSASALAACSSDS